MYGCAVELFQLITEKCPFVFQADKLNGEMAESLKAYINQLCDEHDYDSLPRIRVAYNPGVVNLYSA